MPEYPSGTVAFLFSDIEGSTRRWETRRELMRAAVTRHFALIETAVAAHDGVLFKTIGDAVQAAFHTVPDAIAAAVDGQSALRDEDWGELGPLQVRMGIHAGEATPRDGDYLAPALNRLARVLSTGYGGQVLLTEAARVLATALPAEHGLRDLGQHRLRDLLEAEHVYQLAGPGLSSDFPPLKSLDRQPNNLPAQPTPLIGRDEELVALRDAITSPGTRLMTLTGPGGSGKTRLAVQAAADALDAFPDGVWFVPLATVTEPARVPEEIATVLGVRETAGPIVETLSEHLKTRKMLLVLDNLEQVIDTGPLLNDLLNAAPGLVILATSREPLRLRIEREMPISPLPVPRAYSGLTPEKALESPAVRLFVERAQSVKPAFALDAVNVADVIAICRQLDGLPLAIELAAARIRILTPAALLTRLDRRLALLTGGARDLPERQQTLRAAIAWSHDLLPVEERCLFARLAVFSGGCSLEAAEIVCSAAGGLPLDLIDGVESLVQKSLMRQEDGPGGDARFAMLETIREFAREQLENLPEQQQVREAHADAFLSIAEGANWEDFADQATLLDRLEADHANLRQAISFYEGQGAEGIAPRMRLAAALAHFWWVRGHLSEGRHVLESALAENGDADVSDRAHALFGAALLAEAQWELSRARELHEEALALRREEGDARGIARSLTGLGVIARNEGDLDRARALHQEALDVWRATGDEAGTAGAMLALGGVSFQRGDIAHAEPLLRESLTRFTRLRDVSGEAGAYQLLGVLAITTGDLIASVGYFSESISRWQRLENSQMIAMDLANLGEVRLHAGALDEAEKQVAESLSRYEELGDPVGQGVAKGLLGRIAFDRGDLNFASELLLAALRFCWEAGDAGGAADILDALAEVAEATGDEAQARRMLYASDLLRAETGIQRMPYYVRRCMAVRDAVGADLVAIDEGIDEAISQILAWFPTH